MATINAINNITPTLYGSSIANGNIAIEGTSNATKTTSYVLLQPSGGNVGIGVSTPAAILDIATASGASYIKKTNGTATAYTGLDSSNTYITGTSTAHDWRVVTNNTERFRIDSNGRITTNNTWGTGTGQITSQYIAFSNNGGSHYIGVESSTGGSIIAGTAAYSLVIGNQVAQNIQFLTNNTLALTIDTAQGLVMEKAFYLREQSSTPATGTQDTVCAFYMKADKFVIVFNNGGTTRYKYLDLTGTGTTWTHTTSAP